MSKPGIECCQELALASTKGGLPSIRSSLIAHQTSDWQHDADQEKELRLHAVGTKDLIRFQYVGSNLPLASLFLWERENEYHVANIVPTKLGELSIAQYNTLLTDFLDKVVSPARSEAGFSAHMTEPIRTLDSWIGKKAVDALRRFSAIANKSTTNSHPTDAELWEEFVVTAHRGGKPLDTDILRKWLIEMDGWDERSAEKLGIDYVKGLSLLQTHDRLTQ